MVQLLHAILELVYQLFSLIVLVRLMRSWLLKVFTETRAIIGDLNLFFESFKLFLGGELILLISIFATLKMTDLTLEQLYQVWTVHGPCQDV